jgi:hypothetical protein
MTATRPFTAAPAALIPVIQGPHSPWPRRQGRAAATRRPES